MSRPVTPGAIAPISTSTPATAQSLSNPQRPLSPVSATQTPSQAPAISRSNSQRHVSSGLQQSNQAPNMSRSNSQRQFSTTASVQGQNQAPVLSRSNTQRSAHAGSRPLSYVGGDGTNSEIGNRNSMIQRETSELSQGGFVNDEDHIPINDTSSGLHRSNSQASQSGTTIPSRGGTLKKKASLKKSGSLKRSASKKSSYAGSVRSLRLGEKEKYEPDPEHNSVFYCPVPTSGSPTELLADRFQAWRRVLKDLITYFRDVQKSYEIRSKTLSSASNTINNTSSPSNFLSSGGITDASKILREFHKVALTEANKSKDLENEVILQLTGLRSDLQQKIKEIKSLSGDFKNSVGKEQESTKRVVRSFQESIGHVDHDANSTAGKGDPFLVKMNVDRQIEKQIEEENYLHRAYLNLEASGRELESIVVGEIQKAYNVLANIMKRDADNTYEASEKLKAGPLAMTKDHEWDEFVVHSNQMVDPRVPLRQADNITYTGKDHPAAIEVKSGMLERKSKYLKNYTPGWYVLSPTHLHEFKSADKIAFQSPVMSLYLPEQKLGTHSEPGSNSHKFMLKGRQTGSMHRGHSWIFRAESHDTMMAWFHDIKELTEKRGEERNEFVRRTHARTLSSGSRKAASINSVESGIEEDEADKVPFSGEQSVRGNSVAEGPQMAEDEAYIMDDNRSDPGWRPPQRPTPDRDVIAAAGALPGSGVPFASNASTQPHTDLQQGYDQRSITQSNYDQQNNVSSAYGQPNNIQSNYANQGYASQGNELAGAATSANNANIANNVNSVNNANAANTAGIQSYTSGAHPAVAPTPVGAVPVENASNYGEWMAPMAATAGVGGAALGAGGAHLYHKTHYPSQRSPDYAYDQQQAIPASGQSSAPIVAATAAPIDAPTRPRGMTESTQDTATAMSYAPSAHTQTTSQTMHTTSTVPTSASLIGTEAPAPSQTLAAAGIDPHPVVKPVTAPFGAMGAMGSTGTTGVTGVTGVTGMTGMTNSTGITGTTGRSGVYTGVDPAGHLRPELPPSGRSVQTISDLHVPGEFPRSVGY